jgi:uncharacterized protein YbjT (DUF2867 family)
VPVLRAYLKDMHIIFGGTGHIGSHLSQILLDQRHAVTVVTHDEHKRQVWEKKGARVAVLDVLEVDDVRRVLALGSRAYLLNPPAPPASDTVMEERKTARALLSAISGSSLERVVAESTYGAQAGDGIGDLGVLYDLERGLAQLPIPTAVIRGAYYMSNWDLALQSARAEAVVHTLFPADFELPMVAPQDIAPVAARLLTQAEPSRATFFVEGPAHYSSNDVAAAFGAALNKPMKVNVVPPEQWTKTLRQQGFSQPAAEAMAAMTRITLQRTYEVAPKPERCKTTLAQYIRGLVDAK